MKFTLQFSVTVPDKHAAHVHALEVLTTLRKAGLLSNVEPINVEPVFPRPDDSQEIWEQKRKDLLHRIATKRHNPEYDWDLSDDQ